MKISKIRQEKGDLLIQVTVWAKLVYILFISLFLYRYKSSKV
jgi:hypothetical protein